MSAAIYITVKIDDLRSIQNVIIVLENSKRLIKTPNFIQANFLMKESIKRGRTFCPLIIFHYLLLLFRFACCSLIWYSLLVILSLLLVIFYSLLAIYCSLLVTFCSLLVTFGSLFVTLYSLLVILCSLLLTLHLLVVIFHSLFVTFSSLFVTFCGMFVTFLSWLTHDFPINFTCQNN